MEQLQQSYPNYQQPQLQQNPLHQSQPQAYIPQFTHFDAVILFEKAEKLISADLNGYSDPYIIANAMNRTFKSRCHLKTLNPVFNEKWILNNIPIGTDVIVNLWDKDTVSSDDELGVTQFTLAPDLPINRDLLFILNLQLGKKPAGTIHIRVQLQPSQYNLSQSINPKKYISHISYSSGFLSGLKNDLKVPAYAAYSVKLEKVAEIFKDNKSHWNVNYNNAQKIFGPGVKATTIRGGIHVAHANLYKNWHALYGNLFMADEFFQLIYYGVREKQKRVFTYVILDKEFRFSETGKLFNIHIQKGLKFFTDFLSKHAIHSDASPEVRYAGEFHIRETEKQNQYKLVIDNNSGTYSPSKDLLPLLEQVFKENFPDMIVEALDRQDPRLTEYMKDCEK